MEDGESDWLKVRRRGEAVLGGTGPPWKAHLLGATQSPAHSCLSSFSLLLTSIKFRSTFTRRSATHLYRVHVQTSYGSSASIKEHFRLSTSGFEGLVAEESRANVLREGAGSIVLR